MSRAFQALLGGLQILAWSSLSPQITLLVGSHGLEPLTDFLASARQPGGGFSLLTFPSVLALVPGPQDAGPTDASLRIGPILGVALGLGSLLGVRPRTCAALQVVLYLGYATACRGFLGFQWDNLLLESTLLAVFLGTTSLSPAPMGSTPTAEASPSPSPSPLVHLLFRLLVFKLYFESGLAKWQSPLHDWRDGTAMTFYYETAPLPTALGWYAHHLPRAWHLFESRAVLALELIVPFAIFGPRRARLTAAGLLTAFQVVNAATANYGLFCYLAAALHVFLLDDRDLEPIFARLRRRRAGPWRRMVFGRCRATPVNAAPPAAPWTGRPSAWRRPLGWLGVATWVLAGLAEGALAFGDLGPQAVSTLLPVLEVTQTFRVVNAYHLFASVTRQRIEPEIEIEVDGIWSAHDLRFKPGDPARRPAFVAPHQPRVDFLLWFFGLSYPRPTVPGYVGTLLERLCDEPVTLAPLFAGPLPSAPAAVRIAFFDYHFSSAAEKAATGAWWSRRLLGVGRAVPCNR